MHSTIENEKVIRGPAILRDVITRTDARRGEAAMGGTLLAALRRRFRRATIARQLAALDDRLLADIGIERWQIADVAAQAAAEASPITRTDRTAAGTSFLQTVGRFVNDHVIVPLRRAYHRQVTYRELSALDDRLLRDIGLTRGDIPAVVNALSEGELRREASAHAGRTREEDGHDVLWSLRLWNRSRSAAKALYALDDRTLNDIGLVRGEVDDVAEELALRSLRKPVANRNLPSKAA